MPTLPFSKRQNRTTLAVVMLSLAFLGNALSQDASSKTAMPSASPTPTKTIPSDEELKKKLTPEQYAVTRENATEAPFTNIYYKNEQDGIYVDIISGEALFSSKDKFDTDCGWPGFSKPINDAEIAKLTDTTHGMTRVEVRSKTGKAHLGHVFDDGPVDKGGLRYCINSAALRFVPKERMKEAGYEAYLYLFESEQPKAAEKEKSENK